MRTALLLTLCLLLAAVAAQSDGILAGLDWRTSVASEPTRFELPSQHGPLQLTVLTSALEHPWGLAILPDGSLLVSERGGRLRRVSAQGRVSAPLSGLPAIHAEGQGGLLDLALSPGFSEDGLLYFSYAEADDDGNAGTAVARATLLDDRLVDLQVIFRQQPKLGSGHHYGSRLVFDRGGHLFITLGERGQRTEAQNLANHLGALVRVLPDGSVPSDNPFVGRTDARPEIWSYGHRNMQGAALNPWSGQLWTCEHGPRGGDEINIPQAGGNYGWPRVTAGIDYSGRPIPEALDPQPPGMLPPHHVWAVSPALSGMAFYAQPQHAAWDHSLFIGALVQRSLIRLRLDGDRVVSEERLLQAQGWRIRDVEVSPDGALYLLTDESPGHLLRLDPPPP